MRYEKLLVSKDTATKKKDSSERILKAATELFIEKGYHDVTLRAIAAKADCNLGLITYYYGTKENLAARVYNEFVDEMFSEMDAIHLEGYLPVERLYIREALAWRYLLKAPKYQQYLKFYGEYVSANRDMMLPNQYFISKAQEIISYYNLDIDQKSNYIFLEVLKMTENGLTLKYLSEDKLEDIDFALKICFSNYLYNIGLSDQIIAGCIMRATGFLDNYKMEVHTK